MAKTIKGSPFDHDLKVRLEEEEHRYFNRFKAEYISQSKFWSIFKPEFPENMHFKTAQKNLKNAGIEITRESLNQAASSVKNTWNKWSKDSQDHGIIIHGQLENYGKGIELIHPSFEAMCQYVFADTMTKHKWWNEQCVFLQEAMIAGTIDKVMARTNSLSSYFDYDDYKTNQRRGIEFVDKYNKRMLGPVSHLENCNYNHYSLQLSTYAYMGEKTFNLKAGSLGMWYVKAKLEFDNNIPVLVDWEAIRYPVPYMKAEVENCIDYYIEKEMPKKTLKQLPEVESTLPWEQDHNPWN